MEISPTGAFRFVIATMLGLSIYFTINVNLRQSALRGSTKSLAIESGSDVVVDVPIDGDELSVHAGAQTFTVRLLGVKAFDVSNEPGLGDPGGRAVDSLARVKGKTGTVQFEKRAVDSSGRLLARIEVDGTDLGKQLVQDGWAIVYTKYPFPQMDAYLTLEAVARNDNRGLWSSPKATDRALKVRAGWETP